MAATTKTHIANLKGSKGDKGNQGDQGLPGVNAVANDTATGTYIANVTSVTRAALDVVVEQASPIVGKTVDIPAAAGFNTTSFPFAAAVTDLPGTARAFGTVNVTAESLFDARSSARTAPAYTFYVNLATGDNANAGTTAGTAFKSIWRAVQAANTAGGPSKILVAAGIYPRSHNLSGGSNIYPTVPIALIATGGRVVTGSFDEAGSPTADATHTNTYSWAVANCNKVVDLINLNRHGNYTELRNVATPTRCNNTPGSWCLSGGTLYVNRGGDAPVNTATTRIYRPTSNGLTLRNLQSFYMAGATANDGFDIEGGNHIGVFDATFTTPDSTNRVIAVKNCTFKYGGGTTDVSTRAVSVESWQGLAFFENCRADAGQTDGFNFHNLYGAPSMNVMTVNCTAADNGRAGQQSCNSWTLHENVVGVDIAGHFVDSHGGGIRNIDTSKGILAGTWVESDLGDIASGGNVPPTAFRVDGSAEIWCERTKATLPGAGYAYVTATGTAKIHTRDRWPVASPDIGTGTFDTY